MTRAAIALAVASALFVPASAAASTVSVEGGVLTVTAAAGETNEVYVSQRVPPGSTDPTQYAVKDTGGGHNSGARLRPRPDAPASGIPGRLLGGWSAERRRTPRRR